MEDKNINSVLQMHKLMFDEISFKRLGVKNNNELEFSMQITIDQRQEDEMYRVTLVLNGEKEKEYQILIRLMGYFSFASNENLGEDIKDILINQNAVAIMMPYLRSQVSLLTAQPDVDCVVMQPFNVNNMLTESNEEI